MQQIRPSLVMPSKTSCEYNGRLSNLDGRSQLVVKLRFERPVRSRRLFCDVCLDGISIARLRARAGGGKSQAAVTKLFRFRLPQQRVGNGLLSIAARPAHFLRPGATEAEIKDFGPFPFQVLGVWAF
jgi:hypothetical protein